MPMYTLKNYNIFSTIDRKGKTHWFAYQTSSYLGEGAFGKVYLCHPYNENQGTVDKSKRFVVKISKQSANDNNNDLRKNILNEATALAERSNNVYICADDSNFQLVSEYIPGHDLDDNKLKSHLKKLFAQTVNVGMHIVVDCAIETHRSPQGGQPRNNEDIGRLKNMRGIIDNSDLRQTKVQIIDLGCSHVNDTYDNDFSPGIGIISDSFKGHNYQILLLGWALLQLSGVDEPWKDPINTDGILPNYENTLVKAAYTHFLLRMVNDTPGERPNIDECLVFFAALNNYVLASKEERDACIKILLDPDNDILGDDVGDKETAVPAKNEVNNNESNRFEQKDCEKGKEKDDDNEDDTASAGISYEKKDKSQVELLQEIEQDDTEIARNEALAKILRLSRLKKHLIDANMLSTYFEINSFASSLFEEGKQCDVKFFIAVLRFRKLLQEKISADVIKDLPELNTLLKQLHQSHPENINEFICALCNVDNDGLSIEQQQQLYRVLNQYQDSLGKIFGLNKIQELREKLVDSLFKDVDKYLRDIQAKIDNGQNYHYRFFSFDICHGYSLQQEVTAAKELRDVVKDPLNKTLTEETKKALTNGGLKKAAKPLLPMLPNRVSEHSIDLIKR